jgi:hypothetical protein
MTARCVSALELGECPGLARNGPPARLNPDGDLSGISRLGPDLARNIEAYPAYLPILWNLQEGRV